MQEEIYCQNTNPKVMDGKISFVGILNTAPQTIPSPITEMNVERTIQKDPKKLRLYLALASPYARYKATLNMKHDLFKSI